MLKVSCTQPALNGPMTVKNLCDILTEILSSGTIAEHTHDGVLRIEIRDCTENYSSPGFDDSCFKEMA